MDFVIMLFLTLTNIINTNFPIYFLILVIIGNLLSQMTSKIYQNIFYGLIVVLSFFTNNLYLFLPIGIMGCQNMYIALLSLLPSIVYKSPMTFGLTLVSIYITYKNQQVLGEKSNLAKSRDKIMEDALYLKEKNRQLLLNKEKIEEITALNERNRISVELHDAIGHTISASILQTKALLITCKEENLQNGLYTLQKTLEEGMENIRKTIHHIHGSSFNLENKIMDNLSQLKNVDTALNYKINCTLSQDMKYSILRVVRECISNFIKHSNGNKLTVNLWENKAFLLIEIMDNGTCIREGSGMGLHSIEEIVNKYNGFMNISKENGFKINLALRRAKNENNNNR